jgi:hypothetical protein
MCVCVGNINLNLGGFRGLLTITGSINIQGKKQKQKNKKRDIEALFFPRGEVEKLLSNCFMSRHAGQKWGGRTFV